MTDPRASAEARETDDVELVIVTMAFDTSDPDTLLPVLSKYIVLTRMDVACRNVDLAASTTVPGRFVIIQKWDNPAAQQAHFDSPTMVEMAQSCVPLLAKAPSIDLLEPLSAHDLR